MKINELILNGFRNHTATAIDLNHVNVFVGKNNSGKSSIKAAIEYALTGRCEFTDAAGRGAEELIQRGAKEALIKLTVDGLGYVTRAIPNALDVADWKGGLTVQQDALYEYLAAGADVIAAALNTGRFIDMRPDEQKNLLFNLLGLRFDKVRVFESFENFLGRQGRVIPKGLREYFALEVNQDLVDGGPEVLDDIYKRVYKERTAAKKTLKELEALAGAGEKASTLPDGAWEAREQIRADLAKLRARKEELLQQNGRVIAGRQNIEGLKARYYTAFQRYEAKHKEYAEGDFDQAELDRLESELPALQKKADLAAQELKIQQNIHAGIEANLNAWTAARNLLNARSSAPCPLAPKLTCTADKTKMIEQLQIDIDAATQKHGEALDKLAALEKDYQSAADAHTEASRKLGTLTRAKEDRERVARELDELRQNKEAAKTELDQAEASVTGSAEVQQELDELSQRIPRGDELVQQIAAEERARADRERLTETLTRKRDEVAWLEVLVEAFGPKGIKADLLAGVMGRVQEHANERLGMLTGGHYQIKFDVSKDFDIKVTTGDVTTSLDNLSTSERMRVGIILQDVLNSLTGLRLLVIDDCEILDPGNKSLLINLLLKIRDDYDTIIILSALGETAPRNPGIPGLSVFLVEDGAVRPVSAAQEVV